jgi:hypothetical protein
MSEILTDDVIAAHRLPLAIDQMTAICKAAPTGCTVQQRGEWLVIMRPVIRLEPAKKGGQP